MNLSVNLADIRKKEKGSLLDVPVSPSELFGTSVEVVVEKFRVAFKTLISRRSRSEPEQCRGPALSWSEGQRQAQKVSLVTCAPPPPACRARERGQKEVGKT